MREKERFERGQALVEAALVLPILIILLAGVFDLGRYFVVTNNVQSACDSACRIIEDARGVNESDIQANLATMYPTMADAITVEISDAQMDVEHSDSGNGYRIYDTRSNTFNMRPQTFTQEKRLVTVTCKQAWVTPGMMALSNLVSDGKFTVVAQNTATIDRTLDQW